MKLIFLRLLMGFGFLTAVHAQSLPVKSDNLYISLDEILMYEATPGKDNRLSFNKTESANNKNNTLQISLSYEDASGTILKVQNPFKKMLRYKAEIFSYKTNDYILTSTLPIYPEIAAYECGLLRLIKYG